MAKLGAASGLASMKSGEEDEIAKLIAGRRAKAAAKPDSAKLAKEKDMEAIYSNKSRLDSMVAANRKQWVSHVKDLDATARIEKKN